MFGESTIQGWMVFLWNRTLRTKNAASPTMTCNPEMCSCRTCTCQWTLHRWVQPKLVCVCVCVCVCVRVCVCAGRSIPQDSFAGEFVSKKKKKKKKKKKNMILTSSPEIPFERKPTHKRPKWVSRFGNRPCQSVCAKFFADKPTFHRDARWTKTPEFTICSHGKLERRLLESMVWERLKNLRTRTSDVVTWCTARESGRGVNSSSCTKMTLSDTLWRWEDLQLHTLSKVKYKKIIWMPISTDNAQFNLQVDKNLLGDKLYLPLSLLGAVGLTALLGLRESGRVNPGANQTCVVSGAAGACGSLAGQVVRTFCHLVLNNLLGEGCSSNLRRPGLEPCFANVMLRM